jgi:hypothetical protein
MDTDRYVESLQRQVVVVAEAGGDDARALAERLLAPLEASIRLTIQDALMAAAEEITLDLAPGSVELRLRGREIEFVVTPPPADAVDDDDADDALPSEEGARPPVTVEGDDGAMSRINLRLPDHLKARIEEAATGEHLSVNTWLVRVAAATLDRGDRRRPGPEAPTAPGPRRYRGWAR